MRLFTHHGAVRCCLVQRENWLMVGYVYMARPANVRVVDASIFPFAIRSPYKTESHLTYSNSKFYSWLLYIILTITLLEVVGTSAIVWESYEEVGGGLLLQPPIRHRQPTARRQRSSCDLLDASNIDFITAATTRNLVALGCRLYSSKYEAVKLLVIPSFTNSI